MKSKLFSNDGYIHTRKKENEPCSLSRINRLAEKQAFEYLICQNCKMPDCQRGQKCLLNKARKEEGK